MNHSMKKQNGGVSDDSKARAEHEDWKIYTAHIRKSGGRVPYIRVISQSGRSYVLAVTDAEERKGEVVASCLKKEDAY